MIYNFNNYHSLKYILGVTVKVQNTILYFLLAIVGLGLASCQKSEQDKLIDYSNNAYEWVVSPNYMQEIKSCKTTNELQKLMDKKTEEFVKAAGFKDLREFEKTEYKYRNDKKVKEERKKLADKVQDKTDEVRRYQEELSKKETYQMMNQPGGSVINNPVPNPNK